MKQQLKLLRQLQELDLEKDKLEERVGKDRERLQIAGSVLEGLSADLGAQREQLEGTRGLHRSKRLEVEETQDRLNDAKNKFHGVTNSREYAAAEREVEGFKKSIAQIEEEVGQLANAIAEAESLIAEREAKIGELRKELAEDEAAVDAAAKEIEGRAGDISKQIKTLSKDIQAPVIGRYRFIRSRRPGRAVVSAADGACTGCFMRLPPQLYIELQRGSKLETCQNCQRILYYEENAASEEPAQS